MDAACRADPVDTVRLVLSDARVAVGPRSQPPTRSLSGDVTLRAVTEDRYYEFPAGSGSWVKESVVYGQLTRTQYTADPRVNRHTPVDNVTEFNAPSESEATRYRQGFVLGNGRLDWQPWEPV